MLDPSDSRAHDVVLNQRSRAKLFDVLCELQRPVTTAQLATEVGLHPNGVRTHLAELERAGLVWRTQNHGHRGRPAHLWEISAGTQPRRGPSAYRELAGFLARAIGATGVDMRAAGRQIGRELAAERFADCGRDLEPAMAAMGFAPHREHSRPGRTILRLDNCPYRDAARQDPVAVCALHHGLCEGLVETLMPDTQLSGFVVKDPRPAGCVVELTATTVGRRLEPKWDS